MTAVVGILCRDGVVVGTDSSVTLGQGQLRTIEQPCEKLEVIHDQLIVAGTGEVGLGQRFCAVIHKHWKRRQGRESALETVKVLARNAIEDFRYTFVKPGSYGALVAFPAQQEACLCEFALSNFQPELKTEQICFASMGSTVGITDSFLALMREVFWQRKLPTVQEGILAVTWTLDHAIAVNPGGVNAPARIAVLRLGSDSRLVAQQLDGDELEEHRQNIDEAKERLRGLALAVQPSADEQAPAIPRP